MKMSRDWQVPWTTSVVARSGGLTEAVLEAETGLLLEEQDIGGMADEMLKLLNNHELAEAMGRAGHARVEALFSQERTTAPLQEIMELPDDTFIPE